MTHDETANLSDAVTNDEKDTLVADTKIEWVMGSDGSRGKTWNAVVGCTKCAPGCQKCYAERMAKRLRAMGLPQYQSVVDSNGWTGKIELVESKLAEPLKWKKPCTVFVNSMSDLFHPDVPFGFVDKVWAAMALCPQHTFQVLTKRPDRMTEYFSNRDRFCLWHSARMDVIEETDEQFDAHDEAWPSGDRPNELWNVWLGTSISTQADANRNIPELLNCPAAMRFLSIEPMLEPIRLPVVQRSETWPSDPNAEALAYSEEYPLRMCSSVGMAKAIASDPFYFDTKDHSAARSTGGCIDWVIIGCESGPKRRPCEHEWMIDVVRQCDAAGVKVFVKQVEINGKVSHDPTEWPEPLRRRELPETRSK